MRAFVAVLPPAEVVDRVDDFLAPRRDALAERDQWRWTRREHLHVTLAFMPELEEWRVEPLIDDVEGWVARQRSPRIRLARAGAFPDPGAARVLWAGVEEVDMDEDGEIGEEPVLPAWAKSLRALANHVGGRVEGTRFHPHLTLARSRGGPRPAGHLLQSLDTLHTPAWTADEISLLASYLGEGPRRTPRYEVLHTWSVGGVQE